MSQLLYEAIAATRAGNKKEAQLLLAQNLQQNPTDAQSWYLLGMLVDSKEKQAVYLGKALALDPAHAKAQERLVKLQTPTAVAISDDPLDFLAQAEGDSLPEWLADDSDALQLDRVAIGTSSAQAATQAATTAVSADDSLPDWLQEDVGSSWEQPEAATAVNQPTTAEKSSSPAKSKSAEKRPSTKGKKVAKPQPKSPQQQAAQLNLLLGLMVVALIIITMVLLYYILF